MAREQTSDAETGWANGITLKKTRDGYSWTISSAATDNTLEALREAFERTKEIDMEISSLYGEDEDPRPRRRK